MSGPVTVEFIDMHDHWCISEIRPLSDVVLVLGHLADQHNRDVQWGPIGTNVSGPAIDHC